MDDKTTEQNFHKKMYRDARGLYRDARNAKDYRTAWEVLQKAWDIEKIHGPFDDDQT